jgi:CheY-like chemotaxis protein
MDNDGPNGDRSGSSLEPLILLAEDNQTTAQAVGDYLQMKGYRVQLAANGQEAFDCCVRNVPDLILMDVQMPGVDGLQSIQMIRAAADLPHIPIITLTALAMQSDIDKCLCAGADAYASKPISLRSLLEMIAGFLPQA